MINKAKTNSTVHFITKSIKDFREVQYISIGWVKAGTTSAQHNGLPFARVTFIWTLMNYVLDECKVYVFILLRFYFIYLKIEITPKFYFFVKVLVNKLKLIYKCKVYTTWNVDHQIKSPYDLF